MSHKSSLALFCIVVVHSLYALAFNSPDETELQTYIVHIEAPESQILANFNYLDSLYNSFLPSTINSNEAPRMIYCYHHVMKGFSAKLSAAEVKEMETREGFLNARPEKVLPLHTTHTPDFLGLHQNYGFWADSNFGKGVIIGVIDTGIVPDHPSFSDAGMAPPPAKWKGKCEFNFTSCNNKLIGARSFGGSFDTPLDSDGHGTHTASTAAGNFVHGANLHGLANGTAAGMAPLAHLAMYKICSDVCTESEIIAAMDVAIEDGVDVLSLSIGAISNNLYDDVIALGAYSAMERGIFVSCSAGNTGPFNQSLSNEAPWILTVGASTIDRRLDASVTLGNDDVFHGQSAFQPKDFNETLLPLVYPGNNASDLFTPFCLPGSLNNTNIKGKIVLCESGGGLGGIGKGKAVKDAGGVAMILMNRPFRGDTTFAEAHVLPAIHVSFENGKKIKAYLNSTVSPVAAISYKGTIIGDPQAPAVASFSSRGPSFVSPGILKPDIVGPGVSILAAWSDSIEKNTNTKANFNIISGTSMSCPHLSGVAALIKSAHPDWSPAAIKSAIITTAYQLNLGNKPIEDQWQLQRANIFAVGAGHVNPSKASNPGLVYDIKPVDYIPYLCGLNYTNRQVGVILQRRVNCSEESSIPEAQLNYPSFSIRSGPIAQTYTRTVTNVGEAISTYMVQISKPEGMDVKVEPTTLIFSELNQRLTYEVTFSSSGGAVNANFTEGYLQWTSIRHCVRSPIAVRFSDIF